jgi:putative NADH-flavin reductase
MNITVLGATGGTGRHAVAQALAAGHHVTAVVRDPRRLPIRSERLEIVEADALDGESIAPAVKDRDVVLSAVGPRHGGPTTVCRAAATAVTWAMHQTRTRRLVIVSAAGPYVDAGDDPLTRYLVKPILRRALRESFADLRAAEDIVRGSGLDWTILRPPRLTDKPATGRVRRAYDRNLPLGIYCSRADVAAEMLRAAKDPATAGHSLGIAN